MKTRLPTKRQPTGLKIKTSVKAGGTVYNHSQSRKVKVRTGVKSGGSTWNHNQSRA